MKHLTAMALAFFSLHLLSLKLHPKVKRLFAHQRKTKYECLGSWLRLKCKQQKLNFKTLTTQQSRLTQKAYELKMSLKT